MRMFFERPFMIRHRAQFRFPFLPAGVCLTMAHLIENWLMCYGEWGLMCYGEWVVIRNVGGSQSCCVLARDCTKVYIYNYIYVYIYVYIYISI